jgi:hypothetical protein
MTMGQPALKFESICIFLPTGKTFTFRQATIKVDNETMLILGYEAMSDGKTKTVIIQKSAIVGWAVCP